MSLRTKLSLLSIACSLQFGHLHPDLDAPLTDRHGLGLHQSERFQLSLVCAGASNRVESIL
jgi:hypothetical protein